MIVQVAQWGNSKAIRLPKRLLSEVGFTDVTELEIVADHDHIKMRAVKKELTLESIFADYDGASPGEYDWCAPRGREEW